MFNFILQTFRHRNIIVLFSTPDLSFIDKTARKLFHLTFEADRIDRKNNLCYMKPKIVENNPMMDKIYHKYPVVIRNGEQVKINRIAFGLPSKELIKAYEEKKDAYTAELNKSVFEDLKAVHEKNKVKEKFKPEDYLEEAKKLKKITVASLRANLGLSQGQARMVRALI